MKKIILAAALLAVLTACVACDNSKPAKQEEGPAQGQDNTDPNNN